MDTFFINAKNILNLPFLIWRLSEDFSSQNISHRNLIRENLRKEIYNVTNQDFPNISDLDQTPLKFGSFFASISHSKDLGGFVISKDNAIGFDIEKTDRITKKILEKISSHHDSSDLTPNESFCLKEASQKCISSFEKQIKFQEIKINKKNNYFDISCEKWNIKGRGFVTEYKTSTLALVTLSSAKFEE